MQYQFYGQSNPYYGQPPVPDKRSGAMETAALALGITAIVTCSCIYLSVVCGALSILLALLSRGGEYTMSRRARIALALGIAGLAATIALYVFSYISLLNTYGSLEGILRAYCDMYGLSYEEFFQ